MHWSLIIDGAQYSGRQDGGRTGRARDEADAGDRSRQRQRTLSSRSSAGCSIATGRDHRGARDPGAVRPALPAPHGSIDLIQRRARQDDGVVFFDLAGYDVEGYNKFIPYYLFPTRLIPCR